MTELNYKFIAEKQEQEIKELKLVGKVRDILFNAIEANFTEMTDTARLALERGDRVEKQCQGLEDELEDVTHALGMAQQLLNERNDEVAYLKSLMAKLRDDVSLLSHESNGYQRQYQKALAERGWWAKFKDFLQKPVKG